MILLQILADRLGVKDPIKTKQWDGESSNHHHIASGGETSSDEGEPIAAQQHVQQFQGQVVEAAGSETKSSPGDACLINSKYNRQSPSHQPTATLEASKHNDQLAKRPFKCQFCTTSFNAAKELQMHRFLEHQEAEAGNGRDKENTQMRGAEGDDRHFN